ncbi:MAG: hypothetical protein JRF30_00140 [Deltaproteobacteria bacterium]|nr:hypothetical protein [Deltaproteobacteria bacterium]MBW2329362.1 hypothetical protein [Deltaproteobacteria bacterium]
MLAFKLVAVPGDLPAIAVCAGIAVVRRPWRGAGRRVAGGSDFYNLNEASFGELNPTIHENLCNLRIETKTQTGCQKNHATTSLIQPLLRRRYC